MQYEITKFCREHGFEHKLLSETGGVPQYGAPPTAYLIMSSEGERYMIVCYDNVFYVKVGGGNAFYVKESKEEQSEHDTLQGALDRVLGIHSATQAKREAEARAEYNRRRSEIALAVFPSAVQNLLKIGDLIVCPVEHAFNWAEAFLAEEAKRNGDTQ